jgi:hypothetical protein
MTTSLVPITPNEYAIMPVMDIDMALRRRQAVIDITKSLMRDGQHFGTIPGTNKPTLYKAGAELLTTLFGLTPIFTAVTVIEDWNGTDHNGEPFFFYKYRCDLMRGDMLVATGFGSCNSFEKKYRYRSASMVCPQCGKDAIIKGKVEFGGGWLCFKRKGGCGANFADNDPAIVNQPVGSVPNPEIADLVNTIDKMAQKRAYELVDGVGFDGMQLRRDIGARAIAR